MKAIPFTIRDREISEGRVMFAVGVVVVIMRRSIGMLVEIYLRSRNLD